MEKQNKNVDAKETKIIEENVDEVGYVKVTELTADDIKKLPLFPVEIKKVERTYNGNVTNYVSMTLKIAKGLEIAIPSKNFQISDYYYLKETVLVPRYHVNEKDDNYVLRFPVRFCKGKVVKDDVEYDYRFCQIILAKGIVYSAFINRKNRTLDLLELRINQGLLKGITFIENNKELNVSSDGEVEFVY